MSDSYRRVAEGILMDAHGLMLQYMRSLLLLCLITLISFCAVLGLMRVHYSILLGSIAFALEFVPLAGPLAAAMIILGVSYFSGYPHPLWWIAVFLGVYRILLDYVVSPHLMKKGVELHPLVVLFGVFAGGEIGGAAGIFLSVPLLALIRLLYYESNKRSAVLTDSSTEPALALVVGKF
jgi:predicted PurR-regulated permease PerM